MPMRKPPHHAALAPEYEERPIPEIGRTFRPLDGVRYKVVDGDSFASLAVFAGMNAWELINFNFRTRNAKYVNWYLRNYTGCKKADWDNKNFIFSSDDEPGIIYFPPSAYKRLLESGVTPTPIYLEDSEYWVPGSVPAVFQGFKPTCWAGAATMMRRWHFPDQPTPIRENLEPVGKKWQKKYDGGETLNRAEVREFARECGLESLKVPDSAKAWARALRTHGALMVIQDVNREYNHWIVVIGYRIESPVTFDLKINDPGNSSRYHKSWETITYKANKVPGDWIRVYHY